MVRKDDVPSRKGVNPSGDKFATSYLNFTTFVNDDEGWVEIGKDEYSRSFIRAVNGGGLVWEGETHYATMDEALQALEAGVATWWEEVS